MSQKANRVRSVAVVTATNGSEHLVRCLESVQSQTFPGLVHLVVVDGAEALPTVARQIELVPPTKHRREVIALPDRTGQGGMNGYRIYAAAPFLFNADVIVLLDDDNWYDHNHVESCVETISELNVEWCWSLRRICSVSGTTIIDDDCDSLGAWRRAASYRGDADCLDPIFQRHYATHPFLVDTSCYAIRREVMIQHGSAMLHPYWGDSLLACALLQHVSGANTGLRTVNYRLRPAVERQVTEYFMGGNAEHLHRFNNLRPWLVRQRFDALSKILAPKG